jgi:hypothetical protein
MKIVRDNIMLCDDCTIVACNGDTSGIETDERVKDVEDGLARLGPNLVSDFDSETGDGIEEFSWRGCDCCDENRRKGGRLHRFAILGEGDDEPSALGLINDQHHIAHELGECGGPGQCPHEDHADEEDPTE